MVSNLQELVNNQYETVVTNRLASQNEDLRSVTRTSTDRYLNDVPNKEMFVCIRALKETVLAIGEEHPVLSEGDIMYVQYKAVDEVMQVADPLQATVELL